jgi:hypothetical protein
LQRKAPKNYGYCVFSIPFAKYQERVNIELQARLEAESLLQKYRDRFGDISG